MSVSCLLQGVCRVYRMHILLQTTPPAPSRQLGKLNIKTKPGNCSIEQSPSWEVKRLSANHEIPRVLWNPKGHYRIHSARHLSLSRARSIQSIPPHPNSWISVSILSCHLCLSFPSGLFPSGFSTPGNCTNKNTNRVIPRLTKIIRSGITFVSRNVISRRFQ